MANIGQTLFELQAREQMARKAALRQQEQEQSASNILQQQAGWDRAFKERDQLAAHRDKKEGRALEWAALKGKASGITGTPLEQFETPDEQSQAEAFRQYEGADRGFNIDMQRRAQEAAWAQLGFTQEQNNYRAGLSSADRAAALKAADTRAEEQRILGYSRLDQQIRQNDIMNGMREDDRNYKRTVDMGEREVGGLDILPGRVPTKKSAESLSSVVTSVDQAMNNIDRVAQIYNRSGAEFLFGTDHAVSESTGNALIYNLEALANLGVLQPGDVDRLKAIAPKPNSWRGVIDEAGTKKQFVEFMHLLKQTVKARSAARGYQPAAGSRLLREETEDTMFSDRPDTYETE